MHNRIHDLVIDLACTVYVSGAVGDGAPCVCVRAEFRGKCALR